LAAPILTRLYVPADFGVLAVYGAILSSLLGIASLRYHQAIPVAATRETVANLLALCLMIVIGLAALLSVGLWLFGATLVDWTRTPALAPHLWLLPLSFLGAGAYQVLNAWAIRDNQFGPLARTRFGQGVGLVATQIGLGPLQLGAVGLLIGDAFGRACGSLSLARLAWSTLPETRTKLSFARIRVVVSRYRRFPLISGPSALLASVRGQVPTLILASLYGGQVVGWFGLGQRLLTVTFFLIASSVGDVYLNESARLAREDPAMLMSFFWRTLRRTTLVVLPLLSVLAIVAPMIFGPLFGSEWIEAGRYVRVLSVVSMFDFLGRTVNSTLSVLERQDLDLFGDALAITLIVGALIAGGTLGSSPLTTLIFYSIGGSLAGLINLTFVWYAIRQTTKNGDGRTLAAPTGGS
jgi:O-antigen/teichoic acid export membrane protein